MNKIEKNIKSQLRHLVNIDTNKPEQITLALHMVDLIVTRAFELKAISRATPFVAKKEGAEFITTVHTSNSCHLT